MKRPPPLHLSNNQGRKKGIIQFEIWNFEQFRTLQRTFDLNVLDVIALFQVFLKAKHSALNCASDIILWLNPGIRSAERLFSIMIYAAAAIYPVALQIPGLGNDL